MDLEKKDSNYYVHILKDQDPREELWVSELNTVIGWGIIKKYSDRLGYQYTAETSVYIHPHNVGKKHGKMLKKHLMARCKELGYHHLIARIFAENKVSIDYNLKLGYTLVGIQREIGHVHGEWKDVAILQYVFK